MASTSEAAVPTASDSDSAVQCTEAQSPAASDIIIRGPPIIPTTRCSEGPLFRRAGRGRCSDGPVFRRVHLAGESGR